MTRTNKIHIIIYSLLGILIVTMAIVSLRTQSQKDKLETAVVNSYDRAFFELSDYVSDIDVLLTIAQLASTPAQLASISNEIFMQAAEAKSCFGQLPQNDINLEKTAKFLSQVGDYTYVLSQNMINGQKISQEEYTALSSLNDYASVLAGSLDELESRIYNGEITFSASASDVFETYALAAEDVLGDLENVEKSFEGYPSLIYDGPFSEHIENVESVMLKSAPEISQEEGLKKAKEFLGQAGDALVFESEMSKTAIEAYIYSGKNNGEEMNVAVTKKGGYMLYFLNNREVGKAVFDNEMATAVAGEYLASHGYMDKHNSYYEITNNIATINFAPVENGVKMYSDLVKVRVALDTGEVIGIECKGYLMNHKKRDFTTPTIDPQSAWRSIAENLSVGEPSLAIIPKDSLREVLCYEFHGTYKDKNFIIYINAQNGREEEIMLLIESESGILTI